MTPEAIRELVRLSYAAYDGGDRGFVLDLFDDDIAWTFYAPPEALPVPNRIRGKAAVLAALQRIDEVVEIISNTLELVMVEDDRAAIICDQTMRLRSNGRVMRYKVAAFQRYRQGRLVEHTVFADGFDMMQQTLGREIDVPAAYPAAPGEG